ncbi:MAG: serine/threonine protein kinase [Alphaproteobacteria bacterium]|nr:serine/threonine protein kinase [Alphaproteobacteria bacterium]
MNAGSQYHVESRIGAGGFGAVYRATMTTEGGLQKEVALKVLQPSQASPTEIARLRDEARMLTLLNHRAIVRVYDLVQLSIGWTVVMELVEGLDLHQIRHMATFPPRPAVEVVGEVASALHEAWTSDRGKGPLRLVHRDIKPANLKLSRTGEVKVLDFGIASAEAFDREASTATNEVVGTVRYMAPERFEGRAGPESDVYALGVVLAELLGQRTAGPMHDGRRLEQTLRSVRHMAGPEVAQLLDRMVAYDADERPNALEVARECRRLAPQVAGPPLADWAMDIVPELTEEMTDPLEEDPLVGATLTATRRIQTSPRNPVPVVLAAALAVAVAATAAFVVGSVVTGSAVWVGATATPGEPLRVERMTRIEDVPDEARSVRLSADGTLLTYEVDGDVFLHPIGGRAKNLTASVSTPVHDPVPSPEGGRIAMSVDDHVEIRSLDGSLKATLAVEAVPMDWDDALLLLASGPTSTLYRVEGESPVRMASGSDWRAARWDATSGRALVAAKSGLLWVSPDGTVEAIGLAAWAADVSRDGASLLFSDFDGKESRLYIRDGGGEPHQETHLDGRIDAISVAGDASRAVLVNRQRSTRFRLVEIDAKRKKVREDRVLPLSDDLVAAGLMPDGQGLMWVETNENRAPGNRELLADETLWLATLDGEKTRAVGRLQSVDSTTAGMTADHLVQYMVQELPGGRGQVVGIDLVTEREPQHVVDLRPGIWESLWVAPSGDRIALTDLEGRMHVLSTSAPIDALPTTSGSPGWTVLGWNLEETGVLGLREEDGTLALFDAETLVPTELATDVIDAGYVPDGLMVVQREHALSWFSPEKGKEWPMLEVAADFFVFEPTPDGRFVLVTEVRTPFETWVADLER